MLINLRYSLTELIVSFSSIRQTCMFPNIAHKIRFARQNNCLIHHLHSHDSKVLNYTQYSSSSENTWIILAFLFAFLRVQHYYILAPRIYHSDNYYDLIFYIHALPSVFYVPTYLFLHDITLYQEFASKWSMKIRTRNSNFGWIIFIKASIELCSFHGIFFYIKWICDV